MLLTNCRHLFKASAKDYCHSCYLRYHQIIYKSRKGKNNSNWNSNKTDEERKKDRTEPEYYEFIKQCFERDNYTCNITGKKEEI